MMENTTYVEKSDTTPLDVQALGGAGDSGESGQVMVEYAIIIISVAIGLMGVVGYFLSALGAFYMNLVKVMVLPFP